MAFLKRWCIIARLEAVMCLILHQQEATNCYYLAKVAVKKKKSNWSTLKVINSKFHF